MPLMIVWYVHIGKAHANGAQGAIVDVPVIAMFVRLSLQCFSTRLLIVVSHGAFLFYRRQLQEISHTC